MREVIVLMCLVLATMAHRHEYCVDEDQEKADLDTQNLRLEKLESDLDGFKNKVSARVSQAREVEETIATLKKRLGVMQASGCDDRYELQCGGEIPTCVSRLLTCDNYDDCPNGYDEEECRVFTPAGSIWEGEFVYDKCTTRKPDKIKLTIENYKVIHYLRPFPEVTATIDYYVDGQEFDPSTSSSNDGWMDLKPGNHILYFQPPDTDGLALSCTFDGVDDNACQGAILYENTQETCAEFYLRRVD